MRYFLGYDASGKFVTLEIYNPDGFPLDCDLDCDHPTHEYAVMLKNMRAEANPEVIGFVAYECGHSSGQINGILPACRKFHCSYFDIEEGIIKDKPQIELHLNGVKKLTICDTCVGEVQEIRAEPNQIAKLKFVSNEIPDGASIHLDGSISAILSLDEPVQNLVFIDGETPEVDYLVPMTGMASSLELSGKWCTNIGVMIRGWPTQ